MVVKGPLPYIYLGGEPVYQFGSNRFELPDHIGQILCISCFDRDDCVDMVWHYNEFIEIVSPIPLWNFSKRLLNDHAECIQAASGIKDTLLIVGTDCNEIAIHSAVIVFWYSGGFSEGVI